MATLENVWREGAIGPLRLPHRIVMGSMHLGLEQMEDEGRAMAAFYRERAEGGAALIVTGGSCVNRVGAGGRGYSFVNEDADAAKLERSAAAVHSAGGMILLQLFHAGRYARQETFDLQPVAPSAVYSTYSRCEPRALSHDEVLETIDDFACSAHRAIELGFDGVEIMGSEGYLLNEFMAPVTNLRDDDWGGDAERRMQFPLAVTAAVRSACGDGAAIVYRLSGVDLVEGGASQPEVLELGRRLKDAGADALNVGIGWHEARVPTVQTMVPPAAWTPWAGAVKRAVELPVIASNRINTLELAEEVLAAGDADYVSLARPFLADAEIVHKSRDNGGRAVNVCIACNQACIDRSVFDLRISCIVNPRAGHELELPRSATPASSRGRIAVVGGGPAGMEAARALAADGYRVELFEAGERLGGQFRMASRIPGKEDFELTIEYFERELERLGVAVWLGVGVQEAATLAEFDGVVVATGVLPRTIDLPGAELAHVVSYSELLLGDPEVGSDVAIVGAGGIGVDVAHLLSHRVAGDPYASFYATYGLLDGRPAPAEPEGPSRRVTLMRRGKRVGEGVGPSTRWAVLQTLRQSGVEVLTGIDYRRIEPGAVVISDPEGRERRIPADTVVVAAGQLAEASLVGELEAAGQAYVVIGGAAGVDELDAERAFREGAHAPSMLEALLVGSGA